MSRPVFASAWARFREIHGNGTLSAVADRIGGRVKDNIVAGHFRNACAIRMSYVFNGTGTPISGGFGQTVSGADGKQYLFRVRDMTRFIETKFGTADASGADASQTALAGRRGLLVFDVEGWSDATGHITLWDGYRCSDACYFPEAGSRVRFWELR